MSAAQRRRVAPTVEQGGDEAAAAAQGSDGGARLMVSLVRVPPAAPSVSQHILPARLMTRADGSLAVLEGGVAVHKLFAVYSGLGPVQRL